MKIGLISDTHGFLDEKVFDYFKECDEVWHGGDFGPGVAEILQTKFTLRGVYGNIDDNEIRLEFPECSTFICEEIKVLILHIGGYPSRYTAKAKDMILLEKPDLFISGHSHICKAMRDDKNNLLHLNPGAAGNHGFHNMRTIMRFEIKKAKIINLQVIELGSRSILTP